MAVPRAAQRNHHSARLASLVMASLRAGALISANAGHLDEVEVVQQADPGNPEEDVQPAQSGRDPEPLEQLDGEHQRTISLADIDGRNIALGRDHRTRLPLPWHAAMAPQFIYHPQTRPLLPARPHRLENISLSFYPGAKIGVIGPNGAGKSTLLRIMAGLDDGFTGEARLTPGFTVGYLPRSRSSIRARTSSAT